MTLKSYKPLDNWYKKHGGNPEHRYSPAKNTREYELLEEIGDTIANIECGISDLETELYQLSSMVEKLKKSKTSAD